MTDNNAELVQKIDHYLTISGDWPAVPRETLTAIREALANRTTEPFAYAYRPHNEPGAVTEMPWSLIKGYEPEKDYFEIKPLYATPPDTVPRSELEAAQAENDAIRASGWKEVDQLRARLNLSDAGPGYRKETITVLEGVHNLLFVCEQEWKSQGAWSDYDQSVMDQLHALQAKLCAAPPTSATDLSVGDDGGLTESDLIGGES